MTREELEKEAREYAERNVKDYGSAYLDCTPSQFEKYLCNTYLSIIEPREKHIEALEKENAELLCQKNRNKSCYSCANATERCFRNEIGCPCQKYKSYKEENAELKEKLNNLASVAEII